MNAVRFALRPLVLSALLASSAGMAQQNVPFNNGIPVAPTGLADIKLGAGPWTYHTGEGMDIKVEVVARDIEYPMAMTFTPKGELLVVTRKGKLFSVANGKTTEITGGPASVFAGESGGVGTVHGYIDIVLHPDFAKNQLVYISYSKPVAGSNRGSQGRNGRSKRAACRLDHLQRRARAAGHGHAKDDLVDHGVALGVEQGLTAGDGANDNFVEHLEVVVVVLSLENVGHGGVP